MYVRIPPEAAGKRLSEYLREQGYLLPQPCGGRGTCGKCRVTAEDGTVLLACRTVCPPEGMTVSFGQTDGTGLTVKSENTALPERVDLALDIGTTTIALAVTDVKTHRVVTTRSALNPQSVFGADVITRIGESGRHLEEMQSLLLSKVRRLSEGLPPAGTMTVVGNPTMLSIFCGVSPEPMGRFPFTPAFTAGRCFPGADLGLPVRTVRLLPGASAFVGADVLAGVLYTGMTGCGRPTLLIDVGTNGEMALFDPRTGSLTVTSTAAGPALEGANVSCGMGGVSGALCRVYTEGGQFRYETVENAPAAGICGSGLIDLAACLLEAGILDETGALATDPFVLRGVRMADGVPVAPEEPVLTLTQKDVRELQLAKSAVCSGIEVLLSRAGILPGDLARVYLAGGLGYYLNGASAARIGLLPKELLPVLAPVGNSALAGAVAALSQPEAAEGLAANAVTVPLDGDPQFSDLFVENMLFPEE